MDSLDFLNTHKLILNNKEITDIITSGNSNNDKLTTQGYIDTNKFDKSNILTSLSNESNDNIYSALTIKNNYAKLDENTQNITVDTLSAFDIITDKLQVNNNLFVNSINSNNNNVINLGNKSSNKTNITTNNSIDTFTTDNIISSTIKTASSNENVNISNTNGIITNKIKIGGSSSQEITSIETGTSDTGKLYTATKINELLNNKIDSSIIKNVNDTSTSNIYSCKYINDNYANLSGASFTGNISTTGTITSTGLITANNGLTIPSNKSLTLGSNSVSSILVASGSSNNNKLTSQGYTDATYAKLSTANTFTGGYNTFNNIIYTNGGIGAYNSSTSNINHIKMKFVDNTVSSVDNDYVEFIDDNTTPNTLLRIYQEGKTYSPVFTTQNADYAELFEVYNNDIPIKDYEYKFITLIDDKVKIASNEDEYILGVYSLNPGIIGNYNLDNINSKKNIQVGLLGRLIVIDNGTCKSNSYCKVDKEGYAIPYNKSDGNIPHYRVMKRIDNNKILIMFK